jgi:ferredoxin-NADP reductase
MSLLVAEMETLADGVTSAVLVDPAGGDLPAWEPGAHVAVTLPSGLVRQWSLCGDPVDRRRYRIAVLRVADGRGGSVEFHDAGLHGRTVQVRPPRNDFVLVPSARYLFVAGGIGITPIRPMVAAARRRGADWSLVYGGRRRAAMAFCAELDGPAGTEIVPEDERGPIDVAGVVGAAQAGTEVYCCGPAGLIDAVRAACADRPDLGGLHVERFAAPDGPSEVDGGCGFEVECARSGAVLRIGPGESILDAVLEQVDPAHDFGCTEGYCGSCETKVLGGVPEHRDHVLSDEERAGNDTMMICVGRSRTPRLVLDL